MTGQTEQPTITVTDADPVVACLGRLDATALQGMMATVTAAGYPYLMAHSPADATLDLLPPALDPTAYEEGRVFGPAGELHWRREEWLDGGSPRRGWRVVFTGPRTNCPPAFPQGDIRQLGSHTQQQVTARLWGERRGGQSLWLEPRIPRAFDYRPLVPGNPRQVGMVVVQYIQQGQVDFTRLLGFARWPAQEALDAR